MAHGLARNLLGGSVGAIGNMPAGFMARAAGRGGTKATAQITQAINPVHAASSFTPWGMAFNMPSPTLGQPGYARSMMRQGKRAIAGHFDRNRGKYALGGIGAGGAAGYAGYRSATQFSGTMRDTPLEDRLAYRRAMRREG